MEAEMNKTNGAAVSAGSAGEITDTETGIPGTESGFETEPTDTDGSGESVTEPENPEGTEEPADDDYKGLINASRLKLFGEKCIAPIVGAVASLADSSDKLAKKVEELEKGDGGASVFRTPAVAIGSYTYNGAEQGPAIAGVDGKNITVTGATAVNAGSYTLTLSLNNTDTQVWDDLTTAPKTYEWSIAPKTIEKPDLANTGKTYNGSVQSLDLQGINTSEILVSGATEAVDAGNYTVTFGLANTVNYIWSDGTTAPKSGTWTIEKRGLQKPTLANASRVYNGSAQSPTIPSVNANEIIIGGTTRVTDAGTYTVTYTLANTNNYVWSDNTTAPKSDTWTIGQAAATLSVNKTSVAIGDTAVSATATITKTGDGAISARSSDSSIATVSLSGNTLTITSPNKKNGNATITVSLSGTKNYAAPANKTITVTVKYAVIYGAEWDGTSTSKWSRTDAAAGFTDPNPAVSNGTGSSPFDSIQPWAGMTKEERTGGTMVKIPKYYYKWTKSGARMKLQISMDYFAGSHVSPAHADRGDGKGERSVVYVARYHCATSDLKSRTGEVPKGVDSMGSIGMEDARVQIHNMGANIWQYDFAMYWTIMMLYLVEFADWDGKKTIGYGCTGVSQPKVRSGFTDAMKYHTGTNAANRTTYGTVQYRNIEGLWSEAKNFCDGIRFEGTNVYCIKNPSNFSSTVGGTKIGTFTKSFGYIKAFSVPTENGFEYALIPSDFSGSVETYVCSYSNFAHKNSDTDGTLAAGSSLSQNQNSGPFCLEKIKATTRGIYYCPRIQELP